MWRSTTRILSTLACAMALCILPSTAAAGSYWWTGGVNAGSNGFSFSQTGGWNPWAGGDHCENSATTYGTGSYCQLQWNFPANLDAVSGSWSGTYRQANSAFEQQMFVEGNGNTIVQGTTNTQSFNRQWSDMASYAYIRVVNTGAATNTSAGTVWFSAGGFTINLIDPYNPGLNILEGHGGWKGPGGACIRYGYGEAGSGLNSTSLVNVNTGAVYDNPSYASAAVTTGVFQNDRNCVGVPAPGTGVYTLRAAAVDKSGNYVSNDFNVAFDVTPPNISAPQAGGAAIANGQRFTGSAGQYRPAFRFDYSDDHSGMASVGIYLDGAHVSTSNTYTPASNLALGSHTITVVAADAVGNQASSVRTFIVADDVNPTLSVAAPAADGSNNPVLDVTAADDFSGINPATWSVKVNGAQLAVSATTNRLQVALGRLVNGTHAIEVRVTDQAGNTLIRTISHVASTDARTPPGLNGIYVITPPAQVNEADTIRLLVAVVKAGRPQAGTRVDIKRGAQALADATVAADGYVEVPVRIDDAGDLTVTAQNTGLPAQTVAFQFIPDTTKPTLRVDKPGAAGGSSPLLDVTASDTQSGVAPATWAVRVNGIEVAASSTDARLQIGLGRLSNGTHEIEVRVSDRRGNQLVQTIAYEASGDEFTAPGKTGIYVLTAPAVVDQGFSYRITVIAVKDGRPVEAGRFELVRADGTVAAGKQIGPDGYADILVTDPTQGPYTLRLTGSTLAPISFDYTYRAEGEPQYCSAHPTHTSCQKSTTGGGTTGTTNGTGTTGSGGNAGTSGGPNDKVAPKFTLKTITTKPGVIRRTKIIVLRMTSNERANYTVQPVGNTKATKVAMTTKAKVLRIKLTGALLKRIQNAKTPTVVIKVRVVGIDPNKNTTRKTITLRIRR